MTTTTAARVSVAALRPSSGPDTREVSASGAPIAVTPEHGALRGTTSIPYPARRLQGIALTEYAEAVDKQLIDYVVLSCSTPIAWHVPGTAKGREVWS